MTRVKRLAILALVAQLAGCNFAVKHPVATAAIVGGTIGLGTCAMESSRVGTCAVIGASTATFMGLVTAVALWTMGGDDSHALVDPDMDNPEDGPADIQHAAVIALPPPVATPEPVVEPAPPPSLPPPSRD